LTQHRSVWRNDRRGRSDEWLIAASGWSRRP
jgi:hypothetical protein